MCSIVGITGPIGAGKSAASRVLEEKGFCLIDADETAKLLMAKGEPLHKKVCVAFGLDPEKEIDRPALAAKVFNDRAERMKLNGLTHGPIMRSMIWKMLMHFASGGEYVVLDVPLLLTLPNVHFFCKVLVVSVPQAVQVERIKARNPDWSEEEVHNRIKAQKLPALNMPHMIVQNTGTVEELKEKIVEIEDKLKEKVWYSHIAYWGVATTIVGSILMLSYCVGLLCKHTFAGPAVKMMTGHEL